MEFLIEMNPVSLKQSSVRFESASTSLATAYLEWIKSAGKQIYVQKTCDVYDKAGRVKGSNWTSKQRLTKKGAIDVVDVGRMTLKPKSK